MALARNTPPLDRVQGDFLSYVRGSDNAMTGHVRATRKADVNTLLGVYRNAYRMRLIEALGTNYPALKRVLGDEDFERLGSEYVAARPSRRFSIRWFGDNLADHLGKTAPWRGTPALAELAEFEWALAGAFDAADGAPLDVAAVARIAPADWPALRFKFHPSLALFVSNWTVPEQWRALKDQADVELPPPQRRAAPVAFALWRRDGQTFFRSLGCDESAALSAAREGNDFAALCETLCAHVPEDRAGQRAAELLRAWVDHGWIVAARP